MIIETLITSTYGAEIKGLSKDIRQPVDADHVREFMSGVAKDQSTSDAVLSVESDLKRPARSRSFTG